MAATLFGCSGLTALAQAPDALPTLPRWEHDVSVETGAGYKDNVTLSHAAPEASPFFRAAADAMVFNLDLTGPQFTAFVSGEHRQYFSAPALDDEQLVFGEAQVKLPIHDHAVASLAADYIYQNQVLDVSTTETEREAIRVRGHTLTARPRWQVSLLQSAWIGLEAPLARQYLDEPLDDYWEGGPKIELGWKARRSELTVDYQAARRAYDDLAALDANGAPLPDEPRRFTEHIARLSWRQYWNVRKRWRTTARLGFKANRDNGGGYFDYNRLSGSGEIRYRTDQWDLKAGARASFYQYLVQPAGPNDPSRRERTEVILTASAERKLTRWLWLTAQFEHERIWSNEILDTYTVNTVTGGLKCEF